MSSTNRNKNPIKRKHNQNKRGKKRNSRGLLSTNDDNNNTVNPHPPKRQRIAAESYNTSLQTILQATVAETNALPEPLKTQAIALRKRRNINSTAIHRNNNNQNIPTPMPPMPPIQISSSDDDDDDYYSDDRDNDRQQGPSNKPVRYRTHNNVYRPNPSYNPTTNRMRPQIPPPTNPIPVIPQPRTQRINNTIMPQTQPINNEPMQIPNDLPSVPVPRYINAQDLMIYDEAKCCSFRAFWLLLCALFLTPSLMAILLQWPDSNNYCDTNTHLIKAHNNTENCIECPQNARFCIGGIAKCANNFVVDTDSNECVEISHIKNIIDAYKKVWNGLVCFVADFWSGFMDYYSKEMVKWKSVKEWKLWFEGLCNLSFVDFCKLYELEVMITFFILVRYFVVFRCLIIFFWTRMIIPITNDNQTDSDQFIVISLKLLSYFAPIMFANVVWNKITAVFA